MESRTGTLAWFLIAAAGLLCLIVWYSRFAAAVLFSFLLSALAGSLVSLSFMRNKLAGFSLALGITSLLSFASYLMWTMIIKKAELTLDELNWLLVLYFFCLCYAVAATLFAYPLIASLLHRFWSHRFHHLHIPYHSHEHYGDSHRHHRLD